MKYVWVTGHSLGGADGCVIAKRLQAPLISFGCPRVQFRYGEGPTPITHYRITCDDDPVPHVPGGLLWSHEVEPYWELKDSDNELINPEDHSIDVYYERILNNIWDDKFFPQILTAVDLCSASYDLNDNRFTMVDYLRYGVIRIGEIIWVVLRWTQNKKGWEKDFTAIPVQDMDGSTVHKGFRDTSNLLFSHIVNDINKI